MNASKFIKVSSQVFIGFSMLSLGYVSLLSVYSPQATMELVSTPLTNTDAISSIRGIYGGVGLVIVIALAYLMIKDVRKGVVFLTLFWFAYALSRLITIWVDGALGSFGTQWLVIESVLGTLALLLLVLSRKEKTLSH